jgi:hypothetical protein
MTHQDPKFGPPPGASGNDRDLPLTFSWRVAESAMAGLELPSAKSPRYEDARNAVLTEAAVGAKTGRAISYSRRKEHYVGHQRYFGESYSFNAILGAVADGVVANLLEEERSRPGSRGRQSRFWATSHLSQLLRTAPEYRLPKELIWLRGEAGRLVNYKDCPLTR